MRHDDAPRKAAPGGKRGRDPGVIIGESGVLIVVAIRRLRLTGKAESFPLPR
jgi:hypothetical protein